MLRIVRLFLPVVFLLACHSLTVAARPVLLELFTSTKDCANCPLAEEALRPLQDEFSTTELQIIVYQLNNNHPDWTFDGAVRGIQKGVKEDRLPVAFFNGTSRIEGAKPNMYLSYRDQIVERQANPTVGNFQSWMHLSGDHLVSSVTYQLTANPSQEVEVFYALTEDASPGTPGILRYFGKGVDATRVLTGHATVDEQLDQPVRQTAARLAWWIEEKETGEILHSGYATNQAPFQWDGNQDGQWDHQDVFLLPFIWAGGSTTADRNQDGKVNQLDLVRLLHPTP